MRKKRYPLAEREQPPRMKKSEQSNGVGNDDYRRGTKDRDLAW